VSKRPRTDREEVFDDGKDRDMESRQADEDEDLDLDQESRIPNLKQDGRPSGLDPSTTGLALPPEGGERTEHAAAQEAGMELEEDEDSDKDDEDDVNVAGDKGE